MWSHNTSVTWWLALELMNLLRVTEHNVSLPIRFLTHIMVPDTQTYYFFFYIFYDLHVSQEMCGSYSPSFQRLLARRELVVTILKVGEAQNHIMPQ